MDSAELLGSFIARNLHGVPVPTWPVLLTVFIASLTTLAIISHSAATVQTIQLVGSRQPMIRTETISSILHDVDPATLGNGNCVLCEDVFVRPVRMECQHTYCDGCIRRALTHQESCPLCIRDLFAHHAVGHPMPLEDSNDFHRQSALSCLKRAMMCWAVGLVPLLVADFYLLSNTYVSFGHLGIINRTLADLSMTLLVQALTHWTAQKSALFRACSRNTAA